MKNQHIESNNRRISRKNLIKDKKNDCSEMSFEDELLKPPSCDPKVIILSLNKSNCFTLIVAFLLVKNQVQREKEIRVSLSFSITFSHQINIKK